MDQTDQAIIKALQENGRLSNVDLAERVHLTPGPCLRRVHRLEADGVIAGYQAHINPAAVGQAFEVLVDVDLTNSTQIVDRFESMMLARPEVLELHRMFGSPDYSVRVAVADLDEFETFLTSTIMDTEGIQRVNSRFPMKVLKSLRPRAVPLGQRGSAR
ncbi:Lrp/AsnC family transcriptional regulator [Zhihengliuella flava]|uniref:DNA-binding Lrp family transcriptional regulator n=1 Tax=Zhihengliuella flava TaxID=1285193 RepID=A0A931GEQ1_9MICC|nr:Lrp/AsnC family transcriptional regulator [Zhihengliuella flava]MBG6084365.1 DNA-binding Lrp family transcriptional regulator [Zhihengliuella flava]